MLIPQPMSHTRTALRAVAARPWLFVLPVAFSCLAFAFGSVYLVGLGLAQ